MVEPLHVSEQMRQMMFIPDHTIAVYFGMSVFDNVKGTHRYWKKIRNKLVAKIEQLGPFQIFFTLSCADKRWPEIFKTILNLKGHKVEIRREEGAIECVL